MSDALDETLSVLESLLDLVHARLDVDAHQLFEPAEHLGLHLGAVSRRHLTQSPDNAAVNHGRCSTMDDRENRGHTDDL